MYDFAHCLSDSIEGITHSICTLEFENNRPLYDWFLDQLPVPCHPQQIEFARLNLSYTVMSKRKLLELVEEEHVARLGRSAHAHPRRPAPPRLHARGHPRLLRPHRRGQGQTASSTSALLEHCLREDLNQTRPAGHGRAAPAEGGHRRTTRRGQVEELEAENNPEDPSTGTRQVPFSREL